MHYAIFVHNPNKTGEPQAQPLTDREAEVLRLAAKGQSNRQIAHKLGLSVRTVQAHLANVFNKLKVGSRTEAVISALKNGLLTLHDLTDSLDEPESS